MTSNTQKYSKYEINDILYTKDGRLVGNLTIVDKVMTERGIEYIAISDYGNKITVPSWLNLGELVYYKAGKADATHKYYNYKENYPEDFI